MNSKFFSTHYWKTYTATHWTYRLAINLNEINSICIVIKWNVDLPGFFRFYFFSRRKLERWLRTRLNSTPSLQFNFTPAYIFTHSLAVISVCVNDIAPSQRTECVYYVWAGQISKTENVSYFSLKIYRNWRQIKNSLDFAVNFVLQMCWEYPLSCFRRCRLSHLCWYTRRTLQTTNKMKLANRNLLMDTTHTAQQQNDGKKKKLVCSHGILNANVFFAGTHTSNGNIIKNHTNTDRLRSSDGLMYWTCWKPFVRVAISILLRVHCVHNSKRTNWFFSLALCFSNTRTGLDNGYVLISVFFFSSFFVRQAFNCFRCSIFCVWLVEWALFRFPPSVFPFRLMKISSKKITALWWAADKFATITMIFNFTGRICISPTSKWYPHNHATNQKRSSTFLFI